MKCLTKVVETYRVANEAEAAKVIEEAKKDPRFTLVKYEAVHKEKKAKGEIIDEWVRVTLYKAFNEEAAPDSYIEINYTKEEGYFPEPVDNNETENDNVIVGEF